MPSFLITNAYRWEYLLYLFEILEHGSHLKWYQCPLCCCKNSDVVQESSVVTNQIRASEQFGPISSCQLSKFSGTISFKVWLQQLNDFNFWCRQNRSGKNSYEISSGFKSNLRKTSDPPRGGATENCSYCTLKASDLL